LSGVERASAAAQEGGTLDAAALTRSADALAEPKAKRNSLGYAPRSKSEGADVGAVTIDLRGGAAGRSIGIGMGRTASRQRPSPLSAARRGCVSFRDLTKLSAAAPLRTSSRTTRNREHYSEKIDRYAGITRGASDSHMLHDSTRWGLMKAQLRRIFGAPGTPRKGQAKASP